MIKALKYIFIIVILTAVCSLAWFWHGLNTAVGGGKVMQFTVLPGEGVKKIGSNLHAARLINSPFIFETYVWLEKNESKFLAGDYELNSSQNLKEIVSKLTSGQTISKEISIKIIEGWNIKDINSYLQKNNIIVDTSFENLARAPIGEWRLKTEQPVFLNDAPATADLEGFLFPDTYRIFVDATAEDIIIKTLANFDKKLTPDMRAAIKEQGKSIYQIVTMASVVEKEVRSAADMEIVSGIFWDRIKNGQPLESCATLAYILGENKEQYTIEDTKIESPYNTYQNQGLPPGPIANPGLNAIKAAIYPKHTDYNYFLSRSDNGETVFSKTYDEHLSNKAKYLK